MTGGIPAHWSSPANPASSRNKVHDTPRPAKPSKPANGNDQLPDLTRGDDSAFIAGLRYISARLEPYAHWLLRPDTADAQRFAVADQMVLPSLTCAVGHGIRELAHDRVRQGEGTAGDSWE